MNNIKMIRQKNRLLSLTASSLLLATSGCSSMVTHSGGDQGYYSGTKANIETLKDEQTSWAMTPLVALDLPLSAVMDTLLLPYDYLRADGDKSASSPRERVLRHEKATRENGQDQQTTPVPAH